MANLDGANKRRLLRCASLRTRFQRSQDRNSHAGWFARYSDRTQGNAGVRGVAARDGTRCAHNSPARQDLHVYECTFYRRDSDKEDADLTRAYARYAPPENRYLMKPPRLAHPLVPADNKARGRSLSPDGTRIDEFILKAPGAARGSFITRADAAHPLTELDDTTISSYL